MNPQEIQNQLQNIEIQIRQLDPVPLPEIDAQISPLQIKLDQLRSGMDELMALERKKGYFFALRDMAVHAQRKEALEQQKSALLAAQAKFIDEVKKKKAEMEVSEEGE